MKDPFQSQKQTIGEFVFRHLVEVLLLSGLILLLLTATAPVYERSVERTKVASTYQNLHDLVEALMVYSHEQPDQKVFPPGPESMYPGINLCPIPEPLPRELSFLTTPTAYLPTLPTDPFMSQIVEKTQTLTPFVAHWIKSGNGASSMANEYSNIAWGAFSVGPTLKLPPQYSITVLRRVPYESISLRKNLYDASNGLESLGLIYYDSLGNHSSVEDET